MKGKYPLTMPLTTQQQPAVKMNRVKSSSSRGAWAAVFLALITTVSSFGTIQPVARVSTHRSITATQLSAVTPKPYDPTYKSKPPTFNKETSLWEPSSETETAYGPWVSVSNSY